MFLQLQARSIVSHQKTELSINPEIEWIATEAWNIGVYHFRIQQFDKANDYMGIAISIATDCQCFESDFLSDLEEKYSTLQQYRSTTNESTVKSSLLHGFGVPSVSKELKRTKGPSSTLIPVKFSSTTFADILKSSADTINPNVTKLPVATSSSKNETNDQHDLTFEANDALETPVQTVMETD